MNDIERKKFKSIIIKNFNMLKKYENDVKYFRLKDMVVSEISIGRLQFDFEFEKVKKEINLFTINNLVLNKK